MTLLKCEFCQKLVFSESEFLDRLGIFAPVCFPEIFKHILTLIIFLSVVTKINLFRFVERQPTWPQRFLQKPATV